MVLSHSGSPLVVLLGPPGAGKGTQAERLARGFGWKKISTGDLLRDEVARGTPLGRRVNEILQRGQLVPDDIMTDIVENFIAHHCPKGIILDGFPRTLAQAEALERCSQGKRLWVISIEVPEEEIMRRLSARRVCRKCGKIWNLNDKIWDHTPTPDGTHLDSEQATPRCDCGGELVVRDDDRPEIIAHRLEIYRQQTAPLVQFYRDRGQLIEIGGTGTPDDVFNKVCEELKRKLEVGSS